METIFTNCDGCGLMTELTEYENELLCDRCLSSVLEEEEDNDDYDGFFIGDLD